MALNIEEPQVLLYFDGDALWGVVTVDGDVPAARVANFMGDSAAAGGTSTSASTGRIADSSCEDLGAEVPSDLFLSTAPGIPRDPVGLVRVGTPVRLRLCELVPNEEVAAWETAQHGGAGGARPLGAPPAAEGVAGLAPLSAVMAVFRPRKNLKDVAEGPDEGSVAIAEALKSIRGLNLTPSTSHEFWQRGAGIHVESAEFTPPMAEQAEKEARIMAWSATVRAAAYPKPRSFGRNARRRSLKEEAGMKDNGGGNGGGGERRKDKKGPKGGDDA